MWWQEPVTRLKGIGPKKALEFENINVVTIGDLLNHFPRQGCYLDYSHIRTIGELTTGGEMQLFRGTIVRMNNRRSARNLKYATITIGDGTGFAEIVLFGAQTYMTRVYHTGDEVLVIGKVMPGRTAKSVTGASLSHVKEDGAEAPGILPTYALTGSLTQNQVRGAVRQALALARKELPECLPEKILRAKQFLPRLEALENIHFPKSPELLEKARQRLIFEELFFLQCGLLHHRVEIKKDSQGIKMARCGTMVRKVLDNLGFSLTDSQKKAWQEIDDDMQSPEPMNRLVQGDVGSGKTALALLALAKAVENGYQGCLMAPTEILAEQHYQEMQKVLEPAGIRTALLTGGLSAKTRRQVLEGLADGSIQAVVGTYALIQDKVVFHSLALAITDEQHRFGVNQRKKLSDKGYGVHTLVMSATPIPRTLAIILYADMDISIIKELPKGRKPIKNCVVGTNYRQTAYQFIAGQIAEQSQVYVVCPMVEESETLDVTNVTEYVDTMRANLPAGTRIEMLHGQMRAEEKNEIMKRFSEGEIDVLVSTTVIEVGVNNPNATVMMVENAERFGLAQLHQLRGRVGRGKKQSYCIFINGKESEESMERLRVLENSNDGFFIASEDLKLRGPGDFFGIRQSGDALFELADIYNHADMLQLAQDMLKKYGKTIQPVRRNRGGISETVL